jgi:anti-anti-sigma factor
MTVDPQVAIATNGSDEVVVAQVSGEIDLASAPVVRAELAEAVPNQALGLVVDLTTTSYLDSSGVSLIFELAERLGRRQQQLRLVVPEKAPLRRVLRIVDAAGVVPIVTTVDEASAQIRAGSDSD